MRVRTGAAIVALVVPLAACGSSSKPGAASVPTPGTQTAPAKPLAVSALTAAMRQVLTTKFKVPGPIQISCGGGKPATGQQRTCSVLSSAGRGYRVQVTGSCWTATFDGTIIEGPGLVATPGHPPKGPTGPDNLPDRFSGCAK